MAARKSEVTSGQLRIVGGDKVVADFRDADAAKLFGTLKPGSEFVKSGHSRKKNVVGPRFEIVEMTTDGAGLHVVFRLVKDDSPIERLLAELLDQSMPSTTATLSWMTLNASRSAWRRCCRLRLLPTELSDPSIRHRR